MKWTSNLDGVSVYRESKRRQDRLRDAAKLLAQTHARTIGPRVYAADGSIWERDGEGLRLVYGPDRVGGSPLPWGVRVRVAERAGGDGNGR